MAVDRKQQSCELSRHNKLEMHRRLGDVFVVKKRKETHEQSAHTSVDIIMCRTSSNFRLHHSSESFIRFLWSSCALFQCLLALPCSIALGTRGMCAQNEDNVPTVTHLGALQMSDSGRECWFWVCLPQD